MAKDRNAFKAGLFIVISIVLIIAVIVAIKGAGEFIEPDQIRSVAFYLKDDVGGLRVGDDVRVGGLKVGIVRSIRIEQPQEPSPTEQTRVLIRFNMPQKLIVRDGANIAIQSTLTGTSWLNFASLGDGQPMAESVVLEGHPGTFAVLASSMGELAPEIKRLAGDIRTITLPKVNATADSATQTFNSARANVDVAIERYKVVADRAVEMLTNLRDITGDTKGDIRTLIANIKSATGTLKEKLPPLMDQFETLVTKINNELERSDGVLAEIRSTATNLKGATASAKSILVTNRSKIDEILTSVKAAGKNLEFATAEIRHSPWRLLYKPRPGEMANLNLYDATRQFSEGAGDLSDAASALRDALADPNADKAKLESLVQRLDETFGNFQKVEDDLWKRVQD